MTKNILWVEPKDFNSFLLQQEENISKIRDNTEKTQALEMLLDNYKMLVAKLLEE